MHPQTGRNQPLGNPFRPRRGFPEGPPRRLAERVLRGGLAALVLLGAAGGLRAQAAGPSLEELLGRLRAKERSLREVSLEFRQTWTVPGRKETETYSGRASFGRDGRYRIEREGRRREITVFDGRTLWVHTPEFEQVVARRPQGEGGTPRGGFLNLREYTETLEERYVLSLEDTRDGEVLLAGRPRGPGESPIRIWVDLETLLPLRVEVRSQEILIRTDLLKVEENPGLRDSIFEFKIPEGTEVIHP